MITICVIIYFIVACYAGVAFIEGVDERNKAHISLAYLFGALWPACLLLLFLLAVAFVAVDTIKYLFFGDEGSSR